MNQYPIVQGVERPARERYRGRPPKYPFAKMGEKDFFFVPFDGLDIETVKGRLRSSANYHGYLIDIYDRDDSDEPYTDDDGNEGVRVYVRSVTETA